MGEFGEPTPNYKICDLPLQALSVTKRKKAGVGGWGEVGKQNINKQTNKPTAWIKQDKSGLG